MCSIFNYLDYRQFLVDIHSDFKSRKPYFSHRYISKKVGVASPAWFLHITKGRINLAFGKITPIAKVFHLNNTEADYLELMVHYQHASTIEEKCIIQSRMNTIKQLAPRTIEVNFDALEPEMQPAFY